MKHLQIFGLVLLLNLTSIAFAGDVKVINAKAGFPEGPLWYNNKLYYVEYGSHTAMTWDRERNREFWKMDGCGPSAIVALPAGDFLVTCYDSGSIVRISAGGKTMGAYDESPSLTIEGIAKTEHSAFDGKRICNERRQIVEEHGWQLLEEDPSEERSLKFREGIQKQPGVNREGS